MADDFESFIAGLDAPASDGFAITPTDGVDLAETTRGIYVGGGGNVALVMKSGASLTFVGVVAGTILPVRATRVSSTGTTATNLVGLV